MGSRTNIIMKLDLKWPGNSRQRICFVKLADRRFTLILIMVILIIFHSVYMYESFYTTLLWLEKLKQTSSYYLNTGWLRFALLTLLPIIYFKKK